MRDREDDVTQVQGTIVRDCGLTFAVMLVKEHVMDSPFERARAAAWGSLFFRLPAILVSDRQHRVFGRNDIVSLLEDVDVTQLPWRTYAVEH